MTYDGHSQTDVRHSTWWVSRGAVLALTVLAGCTKPPAPARAHEGSAADTNVVAIEAPVAEHVGAIAETGTLRGANMAVVESNTAAYLLSADASARLDRALSFRSTNDFTFETISNLVADIPSNILLDRIVPLHRNSKPSDPQTMAIMHLYELIMLRGTPPTAALFARYAVGNFYCRNRRAFPERGDAWGLSVLDGATLSPNACKTEQSTYVSILYKRMQRSKGEECLRRIAELEQIAKDGVLPLGQQPAQMLAVFKAEELVSLHRDDEAMKILQELYRQRDTLDPSVRMVIDKGPEKCFLNMRYGTTDPEFIEHIKLTREQKRLENEKQHNP